MAHPGHQNEDNDLRDPVSWRQVRMEHMLEDIEGTQVMTEFTQGALYPSKLYQIQEEICRPDTCSTEAPLKVRCYFRIRISLSLRCLEKIT